MVGLRVEIFKPDTKSCVHCGMDEDELHAFIKCGNSVQAWQWFHRLIAQIYPLLNVNRLHDSNYLFGFHSHLSLNTIKPWKILHAELLRAIWFARNQLLFDDKLVDYHEVIAMVKSRALESIQVYHHAIQFSNSKNRRHLVRRNIRLWTETVPLCILDHNGRLILAPGLADSNL